MVVRIPLGPGVGIMMNLGNTIYDFLIKPQRTFLNTCPVGSLNRRFVRRLIKANRLDSGATQSATELVQLPTTSHPIINLEYEI